MFEGECNCDWVDSTSAALAGGKDPDYTFGSLLLEE